MTTDPKRPHRLRPRRAGMTCLALAVLCVASWPAAAQSISSLVQQAARETDPAAGEPSGAAPAASGPARPLTVPVPVPAVTLYPGDVITPAMLGEREIPAATLDRGGIAGQSSALVGKAARRVLAAGQPVPLNGLADVILVTKGVAARILLKEGGLSISGYGIPLESGSVGAVVRLKNLDSGQVIVGEVEPDGTVRIRMR